MICRVVPVTHVSVKIVVVACFAFCIAACFVAFALGLLYIPLRSCVCLFGCCLFESSIQPFFEIITGK